MRLALDSNLLAFQRPRIIMRGVAETLGLRLIILPEVQDEARRNLVRANGEWAGGKAEGLAGATDEFVFDAITLAEKAAGAWFDQDILNNSNNYEVITPKGGTEVEARRIARLIPDGYLSANPKIMAGDPLIIGQAIAYGASLLSTNNLNTISHEDVNDWASKCGHTPHRALIRSPDETLRDLCEDGVGRESWIQPVLWGCCFNTARQGAGIENWRRFSAAMEGALDGSGFKELAKEVQWFLRENPQGVQMMAAALQGSKPAFDYLMESEGIKDAMLDEAIREAGRMHGIEPSADAETSPAVRGPG